MIPHFIGDFNGNSFTEIDPETGFLTSLNKSQKLERAKESQSRTSASSSPAPGVVDSDVDVRRKDVKTLESRREPRRNALGQWVEQGYEVQAVQVLTLAKKLEIINRLHDLWPNISLACRLSGVSKLTFNNHLALDRSFRECVDEFRESRIDGVEAFRFQIAKSAAGALDRMAVLNAYRPDIYKPKLEVEVKHTMSRDEASDGYKRMTQSVDAEIVETFKRLRPSKHSD